MFNVLSLKARLILLIFPVMLIILFQGWQANHWRIQATQEAQLKLQWQSQYQHLTDNIAEFNRRTTELTNAINQLQQQQQQRTMELHDALQKNKNWGDMPVPDDINRVFNKRKNPR
ncbi:MAG: chemotaxis protein [[Pasteurella] mairii]|nr:chemotaxis protein [[Pasteurella] mairii]